MPEAFLALIEVPREKKKMKSEAKCFFVKGFNAVTYP